MKDQYIREPDFKASARKPSDPQEECFRSFIQEESCELKETWRKIL